jgi:membrane protein YdbS with pleckstrin-like domain
VSDEQAIPTFDAPDDVADGFYHHLDPRHVAHGRLVGAVVALAITFGILLAMIIVLLAIDDMPRGLRWLIPVAALAMGVGLGVLAWRWPPLEHRYTSYRVDRDGIEIRKGVLWRSVVNVSRSRIQHTDVSQGPLERNFGLSTLHIFTAGTEHSEVTLAGLEHTRALRIRDHLLTGGEHDAV